MSLEWSDVWDAVKVVGTALGATVALLWRGMDKRVTTLEADQDKADDAAAERATAIAVLTTRMSAVERGLDDLRSDMQQGFGNVLDRLPARKPRK